MGIPTSKNCVSILHWCDNSTLNLQAVGTISLPVVLIKYSIITLHGNNGKGLYILSIGVIVLSYFRF